MPSVASAHSVSTWSRALPLGIGHVLQDVSGGLRVLFNAMTAPSMLAVVLWSSFESTFVTSFVHLPFPSCRPFDSAYALVLSFPFAGLSLLHLVLKPSIARIATVKLLRHSPHFLEHLAPWAAFQGAMEEMTVT